MDRGCDIGASTLHYIHYMSSDCDVRSDIEKMCAALLQLLPLQDEREALSIQGITYMSDCVLRCAVAVAGH